MATTDRVFASWLLSGAAGLGVAGEAGTSIDRVSATPAARETGNEGTRDGWARRLPIFLLHFPYWTGGNCPAMVVAVGLQAGWPQPDALTPRANPGAAVMS